MFTLCLLNKDCMFVFYCSQGRMDEEVQALLYQILRMTQNNQSH